jgi:hypothetical protein
MTLKINKKKYHFNGQLFWEDSNDWAICEYIEVRQKRKRGGKNEN